MEGEGRGRRERGGLHTRLQRLRGVDAGGARGGGRGVRNRARGTMLWGMAKEEAARKDRLGRQSKPVILPHVGWQAA